MFFVVVVVVVVVVARNILCSDDNDYHLNQVTVTSQTGKKRSELSSLAQFKIVPIELSSLAQFKVVPIELSSLAQFKIVPIELSSLAQFKIVPIELSSSVQDCTHRTMCLWRSVCTLYLHVCQVRVTVGDSGLCFCTCVTSFER